MQAEDLDNPDKLEQLAAVLRRAPKSESEPEPEEQLPSHCIFIKAWIGECRKPTVDGETVCEEHSKEKCQCGEQATRTCDETMGAFVCGAPTCDDCRVIHKNSHWNRFRSANNYSKTDCPGCSVEEILDEEWDEWEAIKRDREQDIIDRYLEYDDD